jgi:hypothetical protein
MSMYPTVSGAAGHIGTSEAISDGAINHHRA